MARRTTLTPLLGVFSISAVVAALLLGPWELKAPDILRDLHVVEYTTKLFVQSTEKPYVLPLAWTLQQGVLRNTESQAQAVSLGAIPSALQLASSSGSAWRVSQGLALVRELVRSNAAAKEALIKEGGLEALVAVVKESENDQLIARAAETLAIFAADHSHTRKKKAANAGAVEALLEYFDSQTGAKSPSSKGALAAFWALANLADAPAVQTKLLEQGVTDFLVKLIGKGPDHRIIQPTLYVAGNLAAGHKRGQEVLREDGVLESLAKLIENEVAGQRSKASKPFHTEVLEHVAELQRSDPAVREALSEVGGLEELLSIIESGSKIKSSGTDRGKQLVAVEEEDDKDSELSSIRALVRDLQDEVDTEGSFLPEVKVPLLTQQPTGAKVLHKPQLKSRQNIASLAAWALGLLVADNPANQDAARAAGAVDSLVKLLEGAEDAFVARNALSAISSLVKNNPTNKAAVREANGVEGLVKLLASNPSDKEVLKATATALKFMTVERPAYETLRRGGSRWFRVLGRQISVLLSERLNIEIPPFAASIILLMSGATLLLAMLYVLLVVRFVRQKSKSQARTA